ncbi:MAG: glycosyltransferase family 4 protein [Bacteroidales bacterium]|nr:glycosyltransferase family 4 protein [Bacteroidales bacterium]
MSRLKPKIIRACTVPNSIGFVTGMIPELLEKFEVGVLASPGKYWEALDKYGNEVKRLKVAMERQISPWKDCISLWKLIRIFHKERPDIVHSMTPKAGLLCMIAAWLNRVPIRIHTFTGLVFPTSTGLKQKILIFTDRLTCACATHIVPEGEGVKNDLINYNITKKPLKVLGYGNVQGIDLNRFNPELPEVKAEAGKIRKEDVFTFVFIGRLVGDKGINELVSAFTRLNQKYPDTRLILVGRYESRLDPLQVETEEEIKNNQAIWASGETPDVRPWLLASDTLVFPSYREGFPNVVIEAGAMGLPSIVTDINGSREIIIEGENGTIIPSKNTQALEEAMERMIVDKHSTEFMASKARQMIAERFEQHYVRKCLKEYYEEILNSRKK